MGWIKRYRNKPPHIRRRFAAITSFVITFVIVFVWISVSTSIFRESTAVSRTDEFSDQVASPFESLSSHFRESMGSIRNQFRDLFSDSVDPGGDAQGDQDIPTDPFVHQEEEGLNNASVEPQDDTLSPFQAEGLESSEGVEEGE